jgi:predicted O-methyltransferase YrrM
MTEQWSAIDEFIESRLLPHDAALAAALQRQALAGLAPINVAAAQGKLLHLLARAVDARRILEVGTLGGYSTIWLARGLAAGGELISLEIDPVAARTARASLQHAGVGDLVDVRVGPALEAMAGLEGPFDLVFIDANKDQNVDYFRRALELSRPGSLIIVDNVVRGGAVLDAASSDRSVQGVRRLFEALAEEPRVTATAIQTVGAKGHDGFMIASVN